MVLVPNDTFGKSNNVETYIICDSSGCITLKIFDKNIPKYKSLLTKGNLIKIKRPILRFPSKFGEYEKSNIYLALALESKIELVS